MDYRIHRISFNGKWTYRILQNVGGPCPLIGLCNVLLLTGDIRVNKDVAKVKFSELTFCLRDHLQRIFDIKLSGDRPLGEAEIANALQNMHDCIALFPQLEEGLDLNIKFSGPRDFEFTSQIAMFDSYNVNILHGWVISAESNPFLFKVIGKMSYNDLVDYLTADEAETSELSEEEKADYLHKKEIAREFLVTTPQQITMAGLRLLYELVVPGQIAIFFHNNHFSTIYRHPRNRYLFTLVTDEGIVDADPRITWQTLSHLHGDEQFCDVSFRPIGGGTLGIAAPTKEMAAMSLAVGSGAKATISKTASDSSSASGYGEGILTEHQKAILRRQQEVERRQLQEEKDISRAIQESTQSSPKGATTAAASAAADTSAATEPVSGDCEDGSAVDGKHAVAEEIGSDTRAADSSAADATTAVAATESASAKVVPTQLEVPSGGDATPVSDASKSSLDIPGVMAGIKDMETTEMAVALGVTKEEYLQMRDAEMAAAMHREDDARRKMQPTTSQELGFHVTEAQRRQQEMALGYYSGGDPYAERRPATGPARYSGDRAPAHYGDGHRDGDRDRRGRRRRKKGKEEGGGGRCILM